MKRLRALNLNHLRLDLWMNSNDWQDRLKQAMQQAEQLDCEIEAVLHLTDDGESQLDNLPKNDRRPIDPCMPMDHFSSR